MTYNQIFKYLNRKNLLGDLLERYGSEETQKAIEHVSYFYKSKDYKNCKYWVEDKNKNKAITETWLKFAQAKKEDLTAELAQFEYAIKQYE